MSNTCSSIGANAFLCLFLLLLLHVFPEFLVQKTHLSKDKVAVHADREVLVAVDGTSVLIVGNPPKGF